MQRTLALLVLAALGLAGCVDGLLPPTGIPRASHWEVAVEPSMAPDFSGMGDTYPVLLVHQHHVASKRQREAWESGNVVCQTTEGEEIPLVAPLRPAPSAEAASAPCVGPAADPATGRVYMDRAAFEERKADAVAILLGGCSGGLLFLDEGLNEVIVQTAAHGFRLERHANRTFSVDGTWIAPGTALKVGYFVNHGSEMDEEYVRVVFDHPGEWLTSRVAGYDEKTDGGIPPRPDQGTGLVVDAPLSPPSPRALLDATRRATPGRIEGIEALRMVHEGERLTEATVRYATDRGSVTWYGAGRTGDALRLLGAHHRPDEGHAGIAEERFMDAFDRPWSELRGGGPGEMTDLRLDPTLAWATVGEARLTLDPALHPPACADGCVLVRGGARLHGAEWGVLLAPQRLPAEGAATLRALAFDGEGAPATRWWHVPEA